MTESAISPITVEPIVRIQRNFPALKSFIFARTNEFTNSPIQNASSEAATMRGVCPKIVLIADLCSADIVGASGREVMT